MQDQRHSDYTASLCEYLLKENQILRAHTPGKLRLTDEERITLAKIGKQLGRKMLKDVASVAKPETILGWYRRLVAKKFDGSKKRRSPGRPRIDTEIEKLILEIVDKNSDRGYDKVAGALANLGYDVSDQTVGNVLKRHGISPAPKRKGGIGWKEFIKAQAAVTAACDFFTVEVLTLRGLLTYYVLFFIHLDESRRVQVAGVTRHPDQYWMEQVARNVTMEGIGFLNGYKKLLQDRDPKFCPEFRRLIESHGIDNVRLPARSPNLNAVAERWVRTVKSECLSKLILLGESSLRRALAEFVAHYHAERNHQEKDNKLLFPAPDQRIGSPEGPIRCKERLGGLLKHYYRKAA